MIKIIFKYSKVYLFSMDSHIFLVGVATSF